MRKRALPQPPLSPIAQLPSTVNLPAPLLLGLSAPACILVARELLRRDSADPEHPLLVVVPTKDAVRLLREQLAIAAAAGQDDGAFICPRIISASQLAAGQGENMASPMLQQAALFCVLRREAERFPRLIPAAATGSEGELFARAAAFCQLFTTLCHEGIPADGSGPSARELAAANPLWQELFSLYPLYCEELHRHGWLAPAEAAPLILTPGTRIILACIPSLSERARQLLESSCHAVEVWLHTDELHEGPGWFDAWGRPGENWLATPSEDVLGLDSADWQERFLVCGDMESMADETARAAGSCGGKSVAVAVCDPGMESVVSEAFARYGTATVRPRGIPFSASGWHRLLQSLSRQAELLEESEYQAGDMAHLSAEIASTLLRDPIFTVGLGVKNAVAVAKAADKLMQQSLPATLGTMIKHAPAPLKEALQLLGPWLSHALSSTQHLLSALCNLAAAQVVEGAPPALQEATTIAASFTSQLDASCHQLQECGWVKDLPVTIALKMLLSAAGFASPPHPARALSLRGWLELSYAPEEHLVLAGLHDGIIPERWPANPYLTPAVIEALGLTRDTARAARDAYLLRTLYRCRPGRVWAVFSLLNTRRDPLFPSSSFFRLTPQQRLSSLVGHFFDRSRPIPATAQLPYDDTGWNYRSLTLPSSEEDIATLAKLTLRELGIANPMAGKPLSPSTLRQFLACPLRFWLSKLGGMRDKSISPTQRDLEASDIGTYLHDALQDFVTLYPSYAAFREAHPEAAEDELLSLMETALDEAFTRTYKSKYGEPELMPRQFQCHAMRRRLRGYARLHLQLWQEGWEAVMDNNGTPMLEYPVDWELDGHPLHFIIDRIDRRVNPESGQWEYRIIDYKTGKVESCYKNHLESLPLPHERTDLHLLDARLEPAVGPCAPAKHAHLRWKDLQLPLYTTWAVSHFAGHEVNSAYIRLSANPEDVRLLAWGDSDKDPDFFTPRFVGKNKNYPEDVEAEPLCDNSLRWIRFGLDAIAEGRCFVSAEMMRWNAPRKSYDIFGDLLELGPLSKLLLRFTPQSPSND